MTHALRTCPSAWPNQTGSTTGKQNELYDRFCTNRLGAYMGPAEFPTLKQELAHKGQKQKGKAQAAGHTLWKIITGEEMEEERVEANTSELQLLDYALKGPSRWRSRWTKFSSTQVQNLLICRPRSTSTATPAARAAPSPPPNGKGGTNAAEKAARREQNMKNQIANLKKNNSGLQDKGQGGRKEKGKGKGKCKDRSKSKANGKGKVLDPSANGRQGSSPCLPRWSALMPPMKMENHTASTARWAPAPKPSGAHDAPRDGSSAWHQGARRCMRTLAITERSHRPLR